ncbi:spore germination protein [Porcipelethomonas sp.]|uniref:spore germination protein n=1 Tax=Porcipelethomonas sp. TaxID=2981675 RepID=UPI003EF7849F
MNGDNLKNMSIIPGLSENIRTIKRLAGETSDLLINEVEISGIKTCLFCCEGLVSTSTITELILHPLMGINLPEKSPEALLNHIEHKMLLSIDRPVAYNYEDFFRLLNSGFALLAADGADYILAMGVQGYDKRGVDEPAGENNLTGAHEGFVEVIRTNMSLIRRRLKSPVLVQKLFVRGTKSQTDLCICYMSDRVPDKLIKRIMDSLDKMELESVLSTGYVKPFLESPGKRIFSSVGMTERPDVLCSKLIEGRVAILVDGNPYALIIPKLVSDNFQTVDDYNFKPYFGTFIRWLKYAAFFISVLLPAFYVAIAMHHPELLNSTLLVILAHSEENAPFSIVAETLGVLIMYEIIKEAGLRLPKAVGGAVSIVAGIIIGDSAVNSGLISTPLLTVAALSIIAGFVIPELSQSITVLRIIFVICGGIWGLYGISLFGAAVLCNMCATEDFGFPYTAPVAPFKKRAMGDVAVRSGFKKMQNNNFTVEELYE